jgi:hypothetical protein
LSITASFSNHLSICFPEADEYFLQILGSAGEYSYNPPISSHKQFGKEPFGLAVGEAAGRGGSSRKRDTAFG